MQRKTYTVALSAMGLALCGVSGVAFAQNKSEGNTLKSNPPIAGTAEQHPLQLAAYQQKPATTSEKTTIKTTEKTVVESGYRGLSNFFNVRESNVNVNKGEWELEVNSGWDTGSGGDDDVFAGLSLKYGVCENTYVELELIPVNLGDGGGHGAGETELTIFHQWTSESSSAVGFGTWASMRIPSGDGSEGVDGELAGAITKSLGGNWRGHINGWVMTTNGEMGDPDGDDSDVWDSDFWTGGGDPGRRDFQWGLGVGVDYQCSADTIGTLNWINRSNDQNGENNDNIMEIGFSHKLADNQGLKFAVDVDVDGADDSIPNVGAKLQWSIEW
jgi:hypothetical protein